MLAEDSTAHPNITRGTEIGGLGFDLKWDLGWVHDTVDHYMVLPPEQRPQAHGKLVFRMHYAFNENYLLPLSHDEVKPAMRSLLAKMPGDDWQKRANLRLLLGYMFALPGKKLLFMGDEFGQWQEWNHDASLDWHLLDDPRHKGLQRWVRDLNTQYRAEPSLHELDCRPDGFSWVDADNSGQGVLTFFRKGSVGGRSLARRLQLQPERLQELPHRRAPRRAVAGDPQQRRDDLRRQRAGQHGQPGHGPHRLARPAAIAQPDPAAPGDPRAQEHALMSWQPTFGALPESGGVRFRVWAHDKRTVEVVLAGSDSRPIPLEKQPDGTFAGLVPGLAPGARYGYLVDGRGPFPDPASRYQPEGVHGPSEVIDPTASPGPTPAGAGSCPPT